MTLAKFIFKPPIAVLVIILVVAGCVGSPTTRVGMVKDAETGIMIGSRVSNTLVTDSSLFKNDTIKVRVRNTSGDTEFDLSSFKAQIENAYANVGYKPTDDDSFGILVDVNVRYSGQIQSNLSAEYGFLGGAAGGIVGYRSNARAGTATGVVAGATLGSILGSYVTDDTYIIVTDVSFAIIKEGTPKAPAKTVTFSRSTNTYEHSEESRPTRSLKSVDHIGVAVYAGGRNVSQVEISGMVRERIVRIVGDII